MRHTITDAGEIVVTFHNRNMVEQFTDIRLLEQQRTRPGSAYGHESSVGYLAEIAWLGLVLDRLDEQSVLSRWSAEPLMATLDTEKGTEVKTTGSPQSYRRFFPNVYIGKTAQLEDARTFVFAYCSGVEKRPIGEPTARGIQPMGARLDQTASVTFVEFADMEALRAASWDPLDNLRKTGFTVSVDFRGVTRPAIEHPSVAHLWH